MSRRQSTEFKPEEAHYKEPETAEEYMEYAKGLLGEGKGVKAQEHSPRGNAAQANVTQSYIEQVNSLLKEVTVDEDGKFQYPADTPEHLKYAVASEKKYRDTQSGFTKSQQSLKEAETENSALKNQLADSTVVAMEIPLDVQLKLDELQMTDPEAWRQKMNTLEKEHTDSVQKKLSDQMSELRAKTGAVHEVERRVKVLESFNEGRQVPVTVDVLDNDIPPRITQKLAAGHLTFEGYLAEVDSYLSKGKVLAKDEPPTTTKLTSAAGSSTTPSADDKIEGGAINYGTVTF